MKPPDPFAPEVKSTDTVTLCTRCRKRSTFMSDRLCSDCRNKDKKHGDANDAPTKEDR